MIGKKIKYIQNFLILISLFFISTLLLLSKNPFNFREKSSRLEGAEKASVEDRFDSVEDFPVEQKPKETWITIFVHGIMGIRPHLSLSNIIRFTKDEVENTEYARAVEIMRNNPLFYTNQSMQELGFKKIDPCRREPGYAAGAMAYLFNTMSNKIHNGTRNNIFYTFGWSGITTESARHQAGRDLYHYISNVVTDYKQRNIIPQVRVIGYSHGGNVALNLGAIAEYPEHPFVVDELILLGTPVQVETDHLIQSPVFKRAYHLFSQADRVQTMDCFSTKRIFSKKTFNTRPMFNLPSKLRQIELKVTDTIRTKKPKAGQQPLTSNNKAFIAGKSRFLRDRSPGHAELWFFGWTPQGYRKNFPLYPLPIIALAPFIVKHVEEFIGNQENKEKIVVDFRPSYGQLIVRQQNNCDQWHTASFLDTQTINQLRKELETYIPHHVSEELYNHQIKQASQQAKAAPNDKFEREKIAQTVKL